MKVFKISIEPDGEIFIESKKIPDRNLVLLALDESGYQDTLISIENGELNYEDTIFVEEIKILRP